MRCNFLSQPKNPKTHETTENGSKLVLDSTSDLPDVDRKQDEEKPGPEMIRDSSTAPETKKRILAATLHSTADETSDIRQAVCQHNLKKEIRMMAKENMVGFGYCSLKIHI